jgi:ribosome maturation factor RimP
VDLGALRERLRPLVEPVVAAAGYDLEDLAVARLGRDFVVRVVIDGDRGVSLDDIADVSRALSAALDAAEEAGQQISADTYTLEVSSHRSEERREGKEGSRWY